MTTREELYDSLEIPKRVHDDCGGEVDPDDWEEPIWWCPTCQDTVFTEDTEMIIPQKKSD